MATAGNTRNLPKEGKWNMNISIENSRNTQVGENNFMIVGGESNTSQKHTAGHCTSDNTRSPTRNYESETNQTYLSSAESLSETRAEMMANEEIPKGKIESETIDSDNHTALSADNIPSDIGEKRCMNISLKGGWNTQVGENNIMFVGGESNTSQKHTAGHCKSSNTRSPTRNYESETNQTYLSSTESLSETRAEMIANEEIPIGRTESKTIDSDNHAALSADNIPSDIGGSLECDIDNHESVFRLCKNTLKRYGSIDSGYYNNFGHIYKTCHTSQQGDEKDKDKKPDNHNDRVENVPSDETIFQQGEPLRKKEDTSFPCLEGRLIYYQEKLLERIGCIKVTYIKETHGTGFRVGSKYFMTAFHVIEDVLTQFWKEVHRRLTDEERRQMEWTKNKIPVDGAWELSKLWPLVDREKKNELMEIGKQSITNCVEIKFEFVRDDMHGSIAQCSYDVAFASPSHDVVILELIGDARLPNPFHLKPINAAATKLHLIGHPGGKKLKHDPACEIIKDQEKLENLKKEGILFFTERGYSKEQVEKDYEPCVLSPDRLFFHCSESITHGASGSPLIVIINEKEAQVIGMLLRGHPKYCYNNETHIDDRLDLLVESGISMEKVRSLLDHHSLRELAVNLFPEQF